MQNLYHTAFLHLTTHYLLPSVCTEHWLGNDDPWVDIREWKSTSSVVCTEWSLEYGYFRLPGDRLWVSSSSEASLRAAKTLCELYLGSCQTPIVERSLRANKVSVLVSWDQSYLCDKVGVRQRCWGCFWRRDGSKMKSECKIRFGKISYIIAGGIQRRSDDRPDSQYDITAKKRR